MAVQAQYPSNILLNRAGQEGTVSLGQGFPLQPQTGGVYFDQSQMLFNNIGRVGINSRKRAREEAIGNASSVPIGGFSMQPTELSGLQIQQPNVSTGLQLAFGDQSQLQQVQAQKQNLLSLLSDDLATQIKHQQGEIDEFLLSQAEQLRRALADKRRRHHRALLCTAEEVAARRLREKEAEMEAATLRNAELETRAAQLLAEKQVWQAKARAQEAAAVSLQAQLQNAIVMRREGAGADGDGHCSGAGEGKAEDAESAYADPERVDRSAAVPACKSCGVGAATVVLLPCRHLCACASCNDVVLTCPLCRVLVNSRIDVIFS